MPAFALLLLFLLPPQPQDPAELSHQAKLLMDRGRFADAVLIYEKLVAALPANPGLRLNLAMALHLSGQDARAIPLFEQVLKQQPNAIPALMLSGASYLRTGQPAKAVPVLEKALTLLPNDFQGRSMLVDAYLMLERPEAALPHLRKLTAAQPENPGLWYGLGRAYEAAAQTAFERLAKAAQDSPWWIALAADARLHEERYTAAFALFDTVIKKQPAFRGAHAALAEIYRKTNHPDWAEIEDAKEKKLPAPACTVPTAACHFLKGRFEAALQAASAGRTPEALYWATRAANELARQAFARLSQLPPSVEFQQFSAEVYRQQGRHADSIKAWQEALRMSPNDPHLRQELLNSIYMSRDYAAAITMAKELLAAGASAGSSFFDSAEIHFILGDSLVNQQQIEDALAPLRRAVALRKDYPAAQAVLGRALLQLGRPEEALAPLKAALVADADGSLHFQLGRAYQLLGRTPEAQQALAEYQKRRAATSAADITITAPTQ